MPTPQRLPIVNSDDGVWGDIIRQWLKKEHYDDGTDNPTENGGHQTITVRAGTATAGTAPIKLTSGTLTTAAETGAIEFNSDNLYFTITTGSVRKKVALYDDTSGATGDLYYRNGSGYFSRLAVGTAGQQLTSVSGSPTWSDTTYPTSTKSSGYTVTATDTVIFANAGSGAVTITLPAAGSFTGYRFYIKRIDSTLANACTVSAGAGTIDGQSSFKLDLQYASVMVVSDGSAWYIL